MFLSIAKLATLCQKATTWLASDWEALFVNHACVLYERFRWWGDFASLTWCTKWNPKGPSTFQSWVWLMNAQIVCLIRQCSELRSHKEELVHASFFFFFVEVQKAIFCTQALVFLFTLNCACSLLFIYLFLVSMLISRLSPPLSPSLSLPPPPPLTPTASHFSESQPMVGWHGQPSGPDPIDPVRSSAEPQPFTGIHHVGQTQFHFFKAFICHSNYVSVQNNHQRLFTWWNTTPPFFFPFLAGVMFLHIDHVPKLEMFCPSVLQLFYGCSKVLMTNHGMIFFLNRLEIRA